MYVPQLCKVTIRYNFENHHAILNVLYRLAYYIYEVLLLIVLEYIAP